MKLTSSAAGFWTRLSQSRVLSALEVLLGGAIVIGHNVFHIVPNEVPILVVLAILSMRLRSAKWAWSSLGFRRPVSWKRIFVIALGAAVLRIALDDFVVEPISAHFWPPAIAPSLANGLTGNFRMVLNYLPLIWGSAAFGEEIGYRGYLLNRAADAGGRGTRAWVVAVILVSVLFGYGHYYKGPAGIVSSGIAGLILAGAYLLSGKNLWTTILAHGMIDTFGLVALYFGWDN